MNPWQGSFVRWFPLLVTHEETNFIEILEGIAMEKDEILNKAIHKREITSRNLGFRQEYEVYCWMKKIAMVQAEQKGI
ncbi:hypothetical protein [Bacillus thuringiensis]|uniref:hypothetical protein n=1 Tax=Bacillus thuringiensis TaxID=1428 RepID=UPI0011A6763E|nr:hypothetical protein [Bacillus thuringiensis]